MKKILILLFNLFFSALLFSENLSGIIVAIVDNNLSTERRGNIYSIYLDENDKINYTVKVINNGSVTLTDVKLNANGANTGVVCDPVAPATLLPGGYTTCKYSNGTNSIFNLF